MFRYLLTVMSISLAIIPRISFTSEFQIVTPESVNMLSKQLANIDKVIHQSIKNKIIPGALVLVARQGKICYMKSFGEADVDKKLVSSAIFRLASMSKPITATAVMQLYDQGKILLNDPVSMYIPEFKHPKIAVLSGDSLKFISARREITIHDLLTMTSGIATRSGTKDELHLKIAQMFRDAKIEDEMIPYEITLEENASRIAEMPLAFQPGEEWEYSNSGVNTLAYLVERVSGMSFDRYLTENIFKPLEMNETMFYPSEEQLSRVPAVFYANSLEKMTKPHPVGLRDVDPSYTFGKYKTFFNAAGGLHGTALDYYKFAQMLLNKGQLNGKRILSKQAVKMMSTNEIGHLFDFLNNKWGYLMSVQESTNTADNLESDFLGGVGCFGWIGFWGTKFIVNPSEDLVIIFMTSVFAFSDVLPIQQRIVAIVNRALDK